MCMLFTKAMLSHRRGTLFLVNSGDKGKGGSVLGTNKLTMGMSKQRPKDKWSVGEPELNDDCY